MNRIVQRELFAAFLFKFIIIILKTFLLKKKTTFILIEAAFIKYTILHNILPLPLYTDYQVPIMIKYEKENNLNKMF